MATISHRLVAEGRLPAWGTPAFRVVSRLRGLDRNIRPGIHRIPEQTSAWRAVDLLALAGDKSGVRVTFPEGRTCKDYAGILERAGLSDSANFATLCRDSAFAAALGLPTSRLEGFLYPDTYLFEGGESPEQIARTLHRRFLEVFSRSVDSASPVWRERGLVGLVTLASIVEREAAVRTEAPRIAGIFWLRLRQGITLGADPTVRYALDKPTGGLTKSDLAVESPYNTRLYAGLPPGPIANPGLNALEAALHPDTAQGYLYFVGKDDGSREHYFGRTLNEHVRFKKMATLNRARTGIAAP